MFSTLVPHPTTVHPQVYAYIRGVAYYTAMDYIGRYAYDRGISFEEALLLDAIIDLREREIATHGKDS